MGTFRAARIAEMIHQEVAERLRGEVKDPELAPISITRVEVTKDLGRAVVFFLPLGGGEVSASLRDALARAAKAIRGPIGRALRLRTAPELVFKMDDKHEEAVRLTALLNQIGAELHAGEAVDEEEDEVTESSDATDGEGEE